MGLGIGERDDAAPGPTGDHPACDAKPLPQRLHVGDRGLERIAFQPAGRRGMAAAALVEADDAEACRIPETTPAGVARPAWSAMTEDDRHEAGVAGILPEDGVTIRTIQHAARAGRAGGMEGVVKPADRLHHASFDINGACVTQNVSPAGASLSCASAISVPKSLLRGRLKSPAATRRGVLRRYNKMACELSEFGNTGNKHA